MNRTLITGNVAAAWGVRLAAVDYIPAFPITPQTEIIETLAEWIQIHCATCQEVLDSILIAYRLCEDPHVRLPVIVNQDGFYLSFTREPVAIPDANAAAAFLPPFTTGAPAFRGGQSISQGVAVLGGTPNSYFRYQAHLALQESLTVYDRIALEFEQAFGRHWPAIDAYRTDDAEVFFMIGAFATKAKDAVDRLREEGWRIGLLRPRLIRPFPEAQLRRLLFGVHAVIVVDQNLSMGKGGVFHSELASALVGQPNMPMLVPLIRSTTWSVPSRCSSMPPVA